MYKSIRFHPLTGVYNRLSWDGEPPAEVADSALGKFDRTQMAHDYTEKGVAVIDNFLSPQALAELLRWMQDGTHWFQTRRDGYVGA